MGPSPSPPPRRPARWSDPGPVRGAASALLAVSGVVALLFGVTWLLWRVAWGLVALGGLFAHTGAHAGLAAALVVVVAASAPLVVTALLTVAASPRG